MLAGVNRQAKILADEFFRAPPENFLRSVVGETHNALTVENDDGFRRLLNERNLRRFCDMRLCCSGLAFFSCRMAGDGAAQRKTKVVGIVAIAAETVFRTRFNSLCLEERIVQTNSDHRRVGTKRHHAAQKIERCRVACANVDDDRINAGHEQRLDTFMDAGKLKLEGACFTRLRKTREAAAERRGGAHDMCGEWRQ